MTRRVMIRPNAAVTVATTTTTTMVITFFMTMPLLWTRPCYGSNLAVPSLFPTIPNQDKVRDATCNVDQLEQANDSQLHSILSELVHTAFFRTFAVDLDERCPISAFDQSKKIRDPEKSTKAEDGQKRMLGSTSSNSEKSQGDGKEKEEEEEEDCGCGVEGDAEGMAFFTGYSHSFSDSTSSSSSSLSSSSLSRQVNDREMVNDTTEAENKGDKGSDDEDDGFHCDGGSVAEEMDDDAPPLCSIANDDLDGSPFLPLSSSLTSLSESPTWESESQKKTFSWTKPIDPVVSSASASEDHCDDSSSSSGVGEGSGGGMVGGGGSLNDVTLPDTFWMDMCSQIKEGSSVKVVNLALNPERNTGYNGTHIWNALYEENCLLVDGSRDSDTMCFEERVLYRLLSGLHASTTVSIARYYYPPSARKNRTEWEPNPTYFWNKFGGVFSSSDPNSNNGHQGKDHVDNMYFSYVVLLRALRKAHDFLYGYRIHTGNVIEDGAATVLLKRLLDSHILRSCSDVFEAFDESLMFKESEGSLAFPLNNGLGASVSLRQNFKEVFHNISAVLDCVQCQQCKLHGKMAMLGYGTALKILFSPPDLIDERTIAPNEVVAFVNTLAKMSDAIVEVRELTQMYWSQEEQERRRMEYERERDRERSRGSQPSSSTWSVTAPPLPTQSPSSASSFFQDNEALALVDRAVGAISRLAKEGKLTADLESEMLAMAFDRDPDLLILAKHYAGVAVAGVDMDMDMARFGRHAVDLLFEDDEEGMNAEGDADNRPDAIVVGSGLAGLAATIHILDRGGHVILIEKERRLGGNSAKASSGINAYVGDEDDPSDDDDDKEGNGDTHRAFVEDTVRSAGGSVRRHLIETLVERSGEAVRFLKERIGVDLSLKAQLGGHTHRRTHRPSNGMAGAEIIYGMQKAVAEYEKASAQTFRDGRGRGHGRVTVLKNTRVTRLLVENVDGNTNSNEMSTSTSTSTPTVVGVEVRKDDDSDPSNLQQLYAPSVILATGGFASDRRPGSLLARHRPELMNLPATAGDFSTGDGILLATGEHGSLSLLSSTSPPVVNETKGTGIGIGIRAGTVDMDKVQVHPTGWVDPTDPTNPTKVLAAELMRGIGGILLNSQGERFCNELGTRAYVTDRMLRHDPYYAVHGQWNATNTDIPTFTLALSAESAEGGGRKHVDLYSHKGLLHRIEGGVRGLASWMGLNNENDVNVLRQTLRDYSTYAAAGRDPYGKTSFRGGWAKFHNANDTMSTRNDDDNDDEEEEEDHKVFYAGTVTPVLHYCMGGITIDDRGQVLSEDHGQPIPGLFAAGEVTGGVHGDNRLGGNSLLECTVFGSLVGKAVPIRDRTGSPRRRRRRRSRQRPRSTPIQEGGASAPSHETLKTTTTTTTTMTTNVVITSEELALHDTPEDCWVAIEGHVYDLTDFADEHPPGPKSVHDLAGTDGTEAFRSVHNTALLEDFVDVRKGVYQGQGLE